MSGKAADLGKGQQVLATGERGEGELGVTAPYLQDEHILRMKGARAPAGVGMDLKGWI